MAFARPYSKDEKAYIIKWQYEKSAGAIAAELNRWPENQKDPRKGRGITDFCHRRRYALPEEAPAE